MVSSVVVFGATGHQGSGVVNALEQLNVKVRGITRDTNSRKSQTLLSKHPTIEVFSCDFNSIESVTSAISNFEGVFLTMDFWSMGSEEELRVGRLVTDAVAQASSVKMLIYSSLENVKQTIGKDCPHFDGKAQIVEYIKSQLHIPCAFVKYSFYYSNFLTPYGGPKIERVGEEIEEVIFRFPIQTKFALVPVEDAGRIVARLFLNPDEYSGKEIGLCGELLNGEEIARIFQAATGLKSKFELTSMEHLPDGSKAMWEFKDKYADTLYLSYLQQSRGHVNDLQTLSDWFKINLSLILRK